MGQIAIVKIKPVWEVVMKNVGLVYSGTSEKKAKQMYQTYILHSKYGLGMHSGSPIGEPVELLRNGKRKKYYAGASFMITRRRELNG